MRCPSSLALVVLVAVLACGCAAAAASPAAQLSDSANELNTAARFGRLDLALEQTLPAFRDRFLDSHRAWGREIRVVDVNVSGIRINEDDSAEVLVEIAWTRMSESTLKNTVVNQSWENAKRAGWQLAREHRVAGDPGLFGEPLPEVAKAEPARDVHFQSKSLGTTE
jgi:hypothetical protein